MKVIEFCQVAAGPFCGMLLSDFGADVMKIEPPEGDSLRQWPPITGGYSENFASLNRGKYSLALNLKEAKDLQFARELILDADVVVENNRPGVMDRLGLGWKWAREQNPKLIYCSISAYGQSGPRSGEGGFDLTVQAAAGVMSVTGEAQGAPVKCGVPVSDFTAGLYAAYSIAAKIAQVRAGGEGGHVDVPMFSTTLAIAALQTSEYFGTGRNPRKLGSAHPRNAPYEAFQGSDGWFVIAAGNHKLWLAVCDVVKQPELPHDPRFQTPALRAHHQAELKDILQPIFDTKPIQHWLDQFQRVGVPHAPINGYAEALVDEQTAHLGIVQSARLPDGTLTRTVGCPVWLDSSPVALRAEFPLLGEHTEHIRAQRSVVDASE